MAKLLYLIKADGIYATTTYTTVCAPDNKKCPSTSISFGQSFHPVTVLTYDHRCETLL